MSTGEHKLPTDLQAEWRCLLIDSMKSTDEDLSKEIERREKSDDRLQVDIDRLHVKIDNLYRDIRRLIFGVVSTIFVAIAAGIIQFILWVADKIK